jgi:hypothetical protein
MTHDLQTLLLSGRPPALRKSHFPYFILDEFAPEELFAQLEAEFPTHDELSGRHQHGKIFINNRDLLGQEDDFFAGRPTWRSVIDFLESTAFVDDFAGLIRSSMFKHRFLGAFRKWRLDTDGSNIPLVERAAQLTYEFSGMPAGSFINPHTDKATKLATFIWHFPEPGWRAEDQGATLLMSPKNTRHNANWANFKLPFEELDVLDRSDVKANRLVMFTKTGNSWHAVPRVECRDDVYRRVFIFNYRLPVENTGTLPVRALESFYRRSEGWRFREYSDVNRKPTV